MKFNIESIKQLAESKGLGVPELAQKIGVTESGLYTMFRKDDMKVSNLQKISEVLEVPINTFFQEHQQFSVAEPQAKYETALDKCQKEVERWKQKAYDCMEKYNSLLEQQIQQQNRQTG